MGFIRAGKGTVKEWIKVRMKTLMIIGGSIGFLLGIGTGISRSNEWTTILVRASVAACVAGTLFKWWAKVWLKSLRDVQEARMSEIEQPTPNPENN